MRLGPGTLYRSIQRMLEQGLLVEPRRRPADDDPAPALLPDHAVRPGGRAGRGPPAQRTGRAGAGAGPGTGPGVMRAYRALLRLYPRSFRAEYGAEMCADFADRRRAADGPGRRLAPLARGARPTSSPTRPPCTGSCSRQDLRYTAAHAARAPGFALTAILVVALGVGRQHRRLLGRRSRAAAPAPVSRSPTGWSSSGSASRTTRGWSCRPPTTATGAR